MKIDLITYIIMGKDTGNMLHDSDGGTRKEKFTTNAFLSYLQKYTTDNGMEIFTISSVATPMSVIHYYHLVKK